MESIRKIRAIVEFSPAKGSNQSYSVYSVVLHISLEEETENLKQAVSEFSLVVANAKKPSALSMFD